MTQPATRDDQYDDDDDAVVEPIEHVALSDPEFKKQLAQVIPHLRAFGRSLSGSRDLAETAMFVIMRGSQFNHTRRGQDSPPAWLD